MRHAAVLFFALLLLPARSFAQTDTNGPDPSKVKVRLGPVQLTPTITIANIGEDGNVFNDAVDPKRDFTMTVSPRIESWFPVMGSWFTGLISEDLVYYQTYSSERSGNTTLGLDWKLPLPRITFTLDARRLSTRERPGFEIDARAARVQRNYFGAIAVNLLPNTSIVATARSEQTDFDDSAVFDGVRLADELNRTATSVTLEVNQKLTPLTTLVFGVMRQQDRFAVDPLRDSDSTYAKVGVRFDPFAVLKGGMTVAYTRFTPHSPNLPDFSGPTLAGDLAYVLLERTRFTFKAQRGLEYSYEVNQPYYIQTGIRLEIAQQVAGPADVAVRGGIARLDYRDQIGAAVATPDRSDRIRSYGIGFGYRLNPDLRVGFDADRVFRESAIDAKHYMRPTYGASITYDF